MTEDSPNVMRNINLEIQEIQTAQAGQIQRKPYQDTLQSIFWSPNIKRKVWKHPEKNSYDI